MISDIEKLANLARWLAAQPMPIPRPRRGKSCVPAARRVKRARKAARR